MTAAFENRFIPASHDVDSLSPRVMNRADHYTTYVRWSGEDACWIGYCPDLFIGGMCHGNIRLEVSARFSILVEDDELRPPPRAVLRSAARVLCHCFLLLLNLHWMQKGGASATEPKHLMIQRA
jgi:hypothetical protein